MCPKNRWGRSRAERETESETVVVKEPTYIYQGTPAPDKQTTKSPESKLKDLKSMYDKGLITKSEYDQKKKQIWIRCDNRLQKEKVSLNRTQHMLVFT